MKKNHPLKDKFVTESYLDLRLDDTKKGMTEIFELRLDETKEEITDEFRKQTAKVLQAVDKIVTRFDTAEKDRSAHSSLHKRITDDILDHGKRIRTLEEVEK
ncbi:MAG: hypothetical protein G01um101433_768 [Parcubacteria group bacterium Gr01-1014_33]|nr:MAG: hypothetical protein G01um101433_768 [Parcubacteria group bacterium Gr01-1014_33]